MNEGEVPATTGAELAAWAVLTALAVGGFCWAWLRGQFADLDRAARLPLEEEEADVGGR